MRVYETFTELANRHTDLQPLLDDASRHPLLRFVNTAIIESLGDCLYSLGDLRLAMNEHTALRLARTQEVWDYSRTWPHEGKPNRAIKIAGQVLYGLRVEICGTLPTGQISVLYSPEQKPLWTVKDAFS